MTSSGRSKKDSSALNESRRDASSSASPPRNDRRVKRSSRPSMRIASVSSNLVTDKGSKSDDWSAAELIVAAMSEK